MANINSVFRKAVALNESLHGKRTVMMPHAVRSIKQQQQVDRREKLKTAVFNLFIKNCPFGKHGDFYMESKPKFRAIADVGGPSYLDLLDKIELAMKYNRKLSYDERQFITAAYASVLTILLSAETIEMNNIKRAIHKTDCIMRSA